MYGAVACQRDISFRLYFVGEVKAASIDAALLYDRARAPGRIVVYNDDLVRKKLLVHQIVQQRGQSVRSAIGGDANAYFHDMGAS